MISQRFRIKTPLIVILEVNGLYTSTQAAVGDIVTVERAGFTQQIQPVFILREKDEHCDQSATGAKARWPGSRSSATPSQVRRWKS